MPWIQLKLNTTGANTEDLSDALMEAIVLSLQIPRMRQYLSRCRAKRACWGDTDVIGLFDAETDMNDVVAILENHPLLGAGFAHKSNNWKIKLGSANRWIISTRCALVNDCGYLPSWRDVPDERHQRDVRPRASIWYRYPSNYLSVPAMARQPRFNR
ncbi:50S ribosomal protein L11 methyltransferase [Shigella sonnei]